MAKKPYKFNYPLYITMLIVGIIMAVVYKGLIGYGLTDVAGIWAYAMGLFTSYFMFRPKL